MSVFKKLLARVGVGSATVDTHLYTDRLAPGDVLEGEVHIIGGEVEQTIDEIYLYVATKYKREVGDSTSYEECKLIRHHVASGFIIRPHEEMHLPFSVQVPYETPLTIGRQKVYIRTGLDIAQAINPKDWDDLAVSSHPLMQQVFEALNSMGFQLYEAECEFRPSWNQAYPFVQEFEFAPSGEYRRWLDELEAVFHLQPNHLEVLLELDKRARGLGGLLDEALDTDERYVRFTVRPADLEVPVRQLAEKIDSIIRQYRR